MAKRLFAHSKVNCSTVAALPISCRAPGIKILVIYFTALWQCGYMAAQFLINNLLSSLLCA